MPTLHVHLDESGNFDFSARGSRYYVFTVAWTYDPEPLATALTRLRFRLLKQSHNLSSFHAVSDRQVNRNAVVSTMLAHPGWRFASIVVDKCKVHPSLRPPSRFYPKFAAMVLRFVLRGRVLSDTTGVMVFTDRIPIDRKRPVEAALKAACRAELRRGLRFDIYHHPKEANAWIQVVDYCCWAVFRKWETGNILAYDQLKGRLAAAEMNVIGHGDTNYYQPKNQT